MPIPQEIPGILLKILNWSLHKDLLTLKERLLGLL